MDGGGMIDPAFWGVLYFMLGIGAVFMLGSMILFIATIGLFVQVKGEWGAHGKEETGKDNRSAD